MLVCGRSEDLRSMPLDRHAFMISFTPSRPPARTRPVGFHRLYIYIYIYIYNIMLSLPASELPRRSGCACCARTPTPATHRLGELVSSELVSSQSVSQSLVPQLIAGGGPAGGRLGAEKRGRGPSCDRSSIL